MKKGERRRKGEKRRKKRGRRREGREEEGGRKDGREEGRKWRENSRDGATILYSQVFLHVYKMRSPFPSLVWQLFFSLGMSTRPRYHLIPPGHCPVESCSWDTRDILRYTIGLVLIARI